MRSPERTLDPDALKAFEALTARRAAREPMAYILGRREFHGLDFEVGPAVLIPRPETETLVEAARDALPDGPATILDLGTGSGCILACLLAARPQAFGVGVDTSAAALEVARRNLARHGLDGRATLVRGHWGTALRGPFDLIAANPPYVTSAEHEGLDLDVRRFEPKAALVGGADGLDAYRAIAADLPRLLRPGGVVVLEVGIGQAADVRGLLAANGLVAGRTWFDLAGVGRCVTGSRPEDESCVM